MTTFAFERVTKAFGTAPALCGVTLRATPGEVVALVGANGSGKTTLLRLLLGLVRPDAGRVLLFGAPPGPATLAKTGAVPEAGAGLAGLSVRENVRFFAALHGLPRGAARDATDTVLEELRLAALADVPLGRLSRGQRRWAALAAGLVHGPELLVLDEPEGGLDPPGRERLHALLARRAARGVTVLLATHDLEALDHRVHRVAVLHRGALLADRPAPALSREALRALLAVRGGADAA